MLYLSICATLLTLLAAMYFLNKVNKENLGSFSKWLTYIIIVVAGLILICQLSRGISRMACHRQECREECEMEGMGHHQMMMRGGECGRSNMECFDGVKGGDSACCGEMKGGMKHHKAGMGKECEEEMEDSLEHK